MLPSLPTLRPTGILLLACALWLAPPLRAQEHEPAAATEPAAAQHAGTPSVVFYALTPGVFREGSVQPRIIRRMVDDVLMALAGRPTIGEAWRVFVQPSDRVGIKVSASGGAVSGTHPAVIQAVVDGLHAAGVPTDHIVVWDRSWESMMEAGYRELRDCRILSTDRSGGYDPEAVVTGAVLGQLIYGDLRFRRSTAGDPDANVSNQSHISSVLTRQVDKVIHIPALTDHAFAAIGGAVTGMTIGNLDNWRRFARAPHFGDPYLAELYADPRLSGKVVVTLLDALRPQYAGGPFPEAQYVVNYGAIFASRDPVALDATGLRLLDEYRTGAKLPKLDGMAHWLRSAEYLGLGRFEEAAIKLIRIGSEPARTPPPR